MKPGPRTLDSYAVLSYLYDQEGADKVGGLILAARRRSSIGLWLNLINLGEVYYIIAKNEDVSGADRAVSLIRSWPLKIASPDEKNVLVAARIKAAHTISYADAFAVATALETRAPLVTGDPEFKAVEYLLEIDWLPSRG